MTASLIVSVVALCVSLTSLGFSAYFGLRDRASLKAACKFTDRWEGSSASISVSIVNAGRRPVVLRTWAGVDKDGNWIGTFFGKDQGGLRLGEHERHDFRLMKDDCYAVTPDEDVVFADLWIEDTLGRRHTVRDATANLAKLHATRTRQRGRLGRGYGIPFGALERRR